jgi:hypothetical protein
VLVRDTSRDCFGQHGHRGHHCTSTLLILPAHTMFWESILFMLAFEASFSAVQGGGQLSDATVASEHALCVSHAVAVTVTVAVSLPQLLRMR